MMKSFRLDEDGFGFRGDSKSFLMIIYSGARVFHLLNIPWRPSKRPFVCQSECPLQMRNAPASAKRKQDEMTFRITAEAFAFVEKLINQRCSKLILRCQTHRPN